MNHQPFNFDISSHNIEASPFMAPSFSTGTNLPAGSESLREELSKAYKEIVSLRMQNTSLQGEVQALTRMIFEKDSQLRALHVGYTNMTSVMQNELAMYKSQSVQMPLSTHPPGPDIFDKPMSCSERAEIELRLS